MSDKPPFDAVVRRHGPAVLRVCRAVVGHREAEDAWSETFLSALRAYPDLPADANVEAWLVRIAHNKAVDLIRTSARQRQVARAIGDVAEGSQPGPEPSLVPLVTALPPRQRQAIAYHYLADLPYAEVAEIIGGTPAAIRRAAADGIAALRIELDKESR